MLEPDPRTWLRGDGTGIADRSWITLYAFNLVLLIPYFIATLLITFLLILLITLIADGHGDFAAANLVPWLVVGGFVAWATSAIWLPIGAGGYLADSLGARRPTADEHAMYEDALELLDLDLTVKRPKHLYVLDENTLNACVVADTLIINRELFSSEFLEAILAHELGHLNSSDARVTVAVNRLGGPARGTEPFRQATRQMRTDGAFNESAAGGCLWGLFMLIVRACSGALVTRMMATPWAGWWRLREYAADDYAAKLGQGEQLANALEIHGLIYDTPIRRIWTSTETHPPVALRIERLRQHQTSPRPQ
jgi:Zn-dependent protease with chaperone function